METIIKPEVVKISEEKHTAVFEIKPCYPGYGLTLGNALRRVLLSSLPGVAITSVRIKGVNHEFSTIPYVLEDIVQFILNLKQIRIKMDSAEDSVQAELKVSGEKEVKAGDIETTSGVEIINKNLHLATLTDKKASLEMILTIQKGIGYIPVEKNEEGAIPIGSIALDAIFSPVVKVNYDVEDMRVGQMTNYNKIKMEIETDGTVEPDYALTQSVKILLEQFQSLLGENIQEESAPVKEKSAEEDIDEYNETPGALKVSELNIPKKLLNILEENNIKTVNKLASKSKENISSLAGIGAKGLDDINKALNDLGLSLKE